MAAARSEHLYSAPTVTLEQSICRAWRLWCRGADLLSSGQEHPCCPGLAGPLPVPGEAESWAVSRPPVLRDLRCWILAPSRVGTSPRSRRRPSELLLEPTAPSTQSLFLCPRRRHLAAPRDPQPPPHRAATRAPQSCSWVNACALQPLGSSVHSPGGAGVC